MRPGSTCGLPRSAERGRHGQYVVDLSVVVVSFNVRGWLAACLRSLEAAAPALRLEVFVVDNASRDGSADMVTREFPGATLMRNAANRGFAPANNQALRLCRGRHVLLLNPDTEVREGGLAELVAFLDTHADVGIVGAQLLNPDGSLQPSGNALRPGWSYVVDALPLHRLGLRRSRSYLEPGRNYEEVREVGEVSGACLMMRREVQETVGLLDERFFFCYEDVDLCIRVRKAGWRVIYDPVAKVVHHGGRSMPADSRDLRRRWERAQLVFIRKHHGLLPYAAVGAVIGIKEVIRGARRAVRLGGRST